MPKFSRIILFSTAAKNKFNIIIIKRKAMLLMVVNFHSVLHADALATSSDEVGEELLEDSWVVFSSSSAGADVGIDLQLKQRTLFTQHLVHKFLKRFLFYIL